MDDRVRDQALVSVALAKLDKMIHDLGRSTELAEAVRVILKSTAPGDHLGREYALMCWSCFCPIPPESKPKWALQLGNSMLYICDRCSDGKAIRLHQG